MKVLEADSGCQDSSGCSSVWSECLVWGQDVTGSNPVIPTHGTMDRIHAQDSWDQRLRHVIIKKASILEGS